MNIPDFLKTIEAMEDNGLVIRSFVYRDGKVQPVYELTPLGKTIVEPRDGDEPLVACYRRPTLDLG
jgi:DNA-binding HxlR family transcriptional regulator